MGEWCPQGAVVCLFNHIPNEPPADILLVYLYSISGYIYIYLFIYIYGYIAYMYF